MIDINELRSMVSGAQFEGFANSVIHSLLDRIEMAEKERDALRAKVERMERDLRLIAETDPVDAALDPQRAVRIARAALEELK